MKKERLIPIYCDLQHYRLVILLFVYCFLFQTKSISQTFVVSFPTNSAVYEDNELPMTVVIAGVKCENTVVKCHKGWVSMIDDCKYLYRCKTIGIDTVEVLVRKDGKMNRIGEQVFEVRPRPLPRASIAGLGGGKVSKDILRVQQGVGAEFFVAGNHWDKCTIERFSLLVLRNGKLILTTRNEGNLFNEDTKNALEQLQPGDKVLITDIKGCTQQGGGVLESLEFTIE